MADAKISALTELAVPPDPTDEFVVVDKSDTSEAASGTDKRIKAQTIDQQIALAALGLAPTGITYQNFSRYTSGVVATGATQTSGTLKLAAIWLPAGATVTNVTWLSGTTGLTTSGTGPHFWVALYSSSRALLRQSNDDTAATWSANSLKTVNLSSTYLTTYSGWHFLGLMVGCGSTGAMPTLITVADTSNVLTGLTPVLCGQSNSGLGATAPDPANAPTPITNKPYCGVA